MVKNFLILFSLFCASFAYEIKAYSENFYKVEGSQSDNTGFFLSGDSLYKISISGRTKLFNKVAAVFNEKNTCYYLKVSENKCYAGFLTADSGTGAEFELPARYEKPDRFIVYNKVFYILARPFNNNAVIKSDVKKVLIRFNPDSNTLQKIDDVMDFILLDGKPLLLKKGSLDYNGTDIPLLLTGNMMISCIKDSRIVFISNGEGSEVIDLLSGKSIYQYKDNQYPEISESYNLVLEFTDKSVKNINPADSGNSVYYEVRVDGTDENRTETGTGEISKIFYTSLEPGKFHIIKPERWELDKIKGRYIRMNNVYQPGELKIFIPEKRIIKIKFEFDGSVYNINQAVLFNR
jgi:hypothetical protein